MTEPKVVDQWIDESGLEYRVFSTGVHDFRAPGEKWISTYMKDGVHGFRDLFSHRIAKLAARVQELEGHAELYRELAARVDDDDDSLVAENARLREGLEKIRNLGPYEMQELADDALKEKQR